MKILLIAGHGQGDAGSVSKYGHEDNCTRLLASGVKDNLAGLADVTLYPFEKNCYKQVKNGASPDWSAYDYVLEIHLNSSNGKGAGSEIYISPLEVADTAEKAILNSLCSLGFKNRGVKRDKPNLLNMKKCRASGTSYALLEVCFIDNENDMCLLNGNKEKVCQLIAKGICDGFGIVYNPAIPQQFSGFFKVQVGAFMLYKYAEKLRDELLSKGYPCFITTVDSLYKVQVGAFSVESNAYAMADDLKKHGYECFVKRPDGK